MVWVFATMSNKCSCEKFTGSWLIKRLVPGFGLNMPETVRKDGRD